MIANRRVLIVFAALIAVMFGLPWGGAVPAASAQTISVTAADPPTGEQGTLSLSVTIKGKGFKNGAQSQFFKTGTTNPAGVTVRSTKYVSATQIVATIDIADTAALAQFDIQVQNTDGRTGKGTELFSVLAKKIDPCTAPDPAPSPGWYTIGSSGVPGALDSTFGSNGTGKVVGPRHMTFGYLGGGRAIAIQADGRIVVVGLRYNACVSGGSPAWGIVRYTPDGALDSSFGSGGMVTLAFAGTNGGAQAVVVQPVDGKIVVVGSANQSTGKKSYTALPVVVRLNPDGSLDGTFGSGGTAWVSLGGIGYFNSVALQADGRIIVAGGWSVVSRLMTNGALDTTFNGSGSYVRSTPGWFDAVTIQKVAEQERIVVAGGVLDSLSHPIGAVWRLDSAGYLDTSFGASGVVTTSFHDEDGLYHSDVFEDVAVDSSNRIVAAGSTVVLESNRPLVEQSWLALARYSPDGAPDPTFGSAGRVLASSYEAYDVGQVLVIQPDDKVVVAGYSNNFGADGNTVDYKAGVWRFNSDGTVDQSFGPGGWGWVPDPIVSGSVYVNWMGIALQADGTIVCGGEVRMGGTTRISYAALARFWQ
jgi:uncharacterized delta-60 repeat protein